MSIIRRVWTAIMQSSMLKTFGKNSAVQAGEQLINVVVGLAVTVYLARELGPALFGVWSLCIALLRIAMTGLAFGLDVLIIRHSSGVARPDESYLTSVLALRAINSLTILVAGLLGLYLLGGVNSQTSMLILVMMPALLVVPFDGLEFWFRATKDALTPAIARSISVILGSALKVALIASGAALVYVGAAHALQMALFGLVLLGFYLWRGFGFTYDDKVIPRVKSLYREAWPLFVTTLGYLVYARIDIVMLSWIQGDHAAGEYAAAVRISEVASLAPVILMTAASPFVFNGMRNNVKKFSALFHVLLTSFNIFFLVVALFVCLLAPLIVHILFGPTYSAAATILSIHIFGLIFLAQGVATQYWWVARRRQNILMWRAIAGGVINIALNAALIPFYGGIGAAIATVASQFFASVGINVFLGRNGWHLMKMQLIPNLRISENLDIDGLVGQSGDVGGKPAAPTA